MALLAQRRGSVEAKKLLKTLKGSGGSGQSTQTAPLWPLTSTSAKQTLQTNRLLRLMLFHSIHDSEEVGAGPLNKYFNDMNCVSSLIDLRPRLQLTRTARLDYQVGMSSLSTQRFYSQSHEATQCKSASSDKNIYVVILQLHQIKIRKQ